MARSVVAIFTALSVAGGAVHAQQRPARFRAEYTVEVRDTAARLFHVTAVFSNIRQPSLDLALPMWTPGWYTIENYGGNVLRFTVKDASGARLTAPLTRVQTWSVDTRGKDRIVAEFDYLATVLAVNQAKITDRYAFFTGTQLFLEPLGHRDVPATVRFVVPPGWRIVSALRETADSTVFTASDYDVLVDAPSVMGSFELAQFEVEGKPHLLVSTPAGAVDTTATLQFSRKFGDVIRTQSAIFGGLPYDKYLVFCFREPAESNGSLEHLNSYVVVGSCSLSEGSLWFAAHEFFHLWNVKRIRPAEMWPYDYSHPNETPSLWVSEGLSNYYADLTMRRAGLLADSSFLSNLVSTMGALESNEARLYVSPGDASVSTWRGLPVAFGANYYQQGHVLGALLDLSIRHDTRGRRSLDDVMRALYAQFYRRGRGFTADDVVRVVSEVTGRDYADFFRRYVAGVEVPPYDTFFGYAGYRVERTEQAVGVLGAVSTPTDQGRRVYGVYPGTPAALAGVKDGDILTTADGVPIQQAPLTGPGGWKVLDRAGRRMVLTILRRGREERLSLTLGTRHEVIFRVSPDSAATPEQLALRHGWLSAAGN
ncbi:MAG: PDZ domain-containing protein [Candidatus Omnitrophota bacterium]|nr:PDZ domain-containing protein [Candidatus Omnitrophota bacterium]